MPDMARRDELPYIIAKERAAWKDTREKGTVVAGETSAPARPAGRNRPVAALGPEAGIKPGPVPLKKKAAYAAFSVFPFMWRISSNPAPIPAATVSASIFSASVIPP